MRSLTVLGFHAALVHSYGFPAGNEFSNYLSNVSILGHSFREPKLINEWRDEGCLHVVETHVQPNRIPDFCSHVLEAGLMVGDAPAMQGLPQQVMMECDKNQVGRVCRFLEKHRQFITRGPSFCMHRLQEELQASPGTTWEFCRKHIVLDLPVDTNPIYRNPRGKMLFDDCFQSQYEVARACESIEPPRQLGLESCSSTQNYWHVVFLLGSTMDEICKRERPDKELHFRVEKALERKTGRQVQQAVQNSCHCHNSRGSGNDWDMRRGNDQAFAEPNAPQLPGQQDWHSARGLDSPDHPANINRGLHSRDMWNERDRPGAPYPWTGPGMMPSPQGPGMMPPHRPLGPDMAYPPGPGLRSGLGSPYQPYVPQGALLPQSDIEKLMRLSQKFGFEVRNGLFAISDMPQEARNAGVSWRLVYDLDVDAKASSRWRFEICDPREQGRVVTKIGDQYIYGFPLEINGQAWSSATISSDGPNELLCDDGSLTYVKVKAKAVADVRPADEALAARKRGQFIRCNDVSKCHQTKCESNTCNFNLVASVTADAKAGADSATATATARASFKFDFEPCQTPTVCNCVRTCAEDTNCMVQKPIRGVAPAPVPREQVRGATVADLAHAIAAAKAGHTDGGVYGAAEAEAGVRGSGDRGLRGSMGGRRPGFHDSVSPNDHRAGFAPGSGHVEAQSEVTIGDFDGSPFAREGFYNSTEDRLGFPGSAFGNKGAGWNPSSRADGSVVFAGCGRVSFASEILIGAVGLALLF
ncbi:hypothetical protein CDD80_5029 [Ophiocordyceps camponoti-rufipedis]|uniref:Uncharacterized protein n=1 Tax=Ophiocordyceps camponoti-rufipedis TaxID=2004952 RepID=A0A2C5ZJG6_9HYPO|nr:hypothetical protein CDD80_5029 [Ophiocordyceps camponoti-rufipedis]